jgi:hypothetical protein
VQQALPVHLPPDLAHAIYGEVVVEDAPDRGLERFVPLGSIGQPVRFTPLGGMVMVSGRGDRQDLTDRLDPMRIPVIVDESDHGLNRRSSSACAK